VTLHYYDFLVYSVFATSCVVYFYIYYIINLELTVKLNTITLQSLFRSPRKNFNHHIEYVMQHVVKFTLKFIAVRFGTL